jgi:hypothetical protein
MVAAAKGVLMVNGRMICGGKGVERMVAVD